MLLIRFHLFFNSAKHSSDLFLVLSQGADALFERRNLLVCDSVSFKVHPFIFGIDRFVFGTSSFPALVLSTLLLGNHLHNLFFGVQSGLPSTEMALGAHPVDLI